MKPLVILLTFFALAFSPVLSSQSLAEEVADAKLSRGSYVPGELIIHGTSRLTSQNIAAIFHAIDIPVRAKRLTQDGTYFLVRLAVDAPRSNSRLTRLYERMVDAVVCERIAGNPGEGPMSEVDGFWPNYVVDPGDEFVSNIFNNNDEDICFTVSADEYNPLGSCPDHRDMPNPQIGSSMVSVAIMDTGLDPTQYPQFFKDLQTGASITQSFPVAETEYLDNDPEGMDVNGHGTAVATLIAHRFYEAHSLNHLRLNSYKILNKNGLGTVAALINALDQAINYKVDIINLSLGFVGEECDEFISSLLSPLFIKARDEDILIFTSAGNDGNGLAVHAQYPANNSPSSSKFFTVGASSCEDETTWSESNFDINIVDFTAPGQDIIVPYVKFGCYIKVSGTSFAAPLSASIAAALRSKYSVIRTVCTLESRLTPNHPGQHIPGTAESRLGSITFLGNDYVGECDDDAQVEALANQPGTNGAYPNPVWNVLNIPVTEEEIAANASIRISDLGGRELYQTQVRSRLVKVPTKELPPGIYILSIMNGDKARITKFIKR